MKKYEKRIHYRQIRYQKVPFILFHTHMCMPKYERYSLALYLSITYVCTIHILTITYMCMKKYKRYRICLIMYVPFIF